MPETSYSQQLRGRLKRHGLPARRIDRLVEEIGDHWDDLSEEGMATGLSPGAAAQHAEQRLGTPDLLADRLVTGLRAGGQRQLFFTTDDN